MRYFIVNNPETRSVMSAEYDIQPPNSLPYYNHGFILPVFDQYPNPTAVIEGMTEEQIQQQIQEAALEIETNLYLKRINDGINAVARLSAELRLAKLSGQISEEGHKYIDALLVPIRNEVLAGQWIGAKDLLIELGSSQVGETLYNKLLIELNAYISENY